MGQGRTRPCRGSSSRYLGSLQASNKAGARDEQLETPSDCTEPGVVPKLEARLGERWRLDVVHLNPFKCRAPIQLQVRKIFKQRIYRSS